jgi:NTE family protein
VGRGPGESVGAFGAINRHLTHGNRAPGRSVCAGWRHRGRGAGTWDEALWFATLRALLDDHFADRRLEDLQVSAHGVTTDLGSGAAHVISAGPVVEALLASAAIPGLFPPVSIDGRHLVDWALAANTPVRQAVDLGATNIYILAGATLGRIGDLTARADLALSALDNMVDAGTARHPHGALARVHLMPAPPSPTDNILDFRHSSELIAESYRLTRRWLAEAQPAATAAA